MAVLKLTLSPDPLLRRRTRWVKQIDSSIHKIIDDMIETMQAERGVGLAANQVGIPLRLAVIQPEPDDEPIVLVNPEIVRRKGEREVVEGCLSIPGYRGSVRRSVRVRAKALDRNGKEFRIKAEGDVLAQVLEHETDHLNGVLYTDHLVNDQLRPVGAETPEPEDYSKPLASTAP